MFYQKERDRMTLKTTFESCLANQNISNQILCKTKIHFISLKIAT